MKKRILVYNIAIIFLLVNLTSLFDISSRALINVNLENISSTIEEEWYYLPGFPNYCPNGLPDFDQRQQDDWSGKEGYSIFCGPTSLANILWWFDSKHSDPNGKPGDGNDSYPLVCNYNAPGNPNPGEYSDDHNFNNVNDMVTPWGKFSKNGELLERIASYIDTGWFKIPFISFSGSDHFQIKWGLKKWFRHVGLQCDYNVEIIFRPSFTLISEKVRQNQGIMLSIAFYNPETKFLPFDFGHWISVAGVNSNGSIAISDPIIDIDNPLPPAVNHTYHNNASIVSHDKYTINETSPCPRLAKFWMPEYPIGKGALIFGAVIISEK